MMIYGRIFILMALVSLKVTGDTSILTRVTENIAVIVEGENGLNQSLLVVSHFDSSTLSPGT